MLKIISQILITFIMVAMMIVTTAASGSDDQLLAVRLKAALHSEHITLEQFLPLISEQSGIQFAAAPEVAEMIVDVQSEAQQNVKEVLDMLCQRYQLTFQYNAEHNTILIMKGRSLASPMLYRSESHIVAGKAHFIAMPAPPPVMGMYNYQYNTEEYKRIYDNQMRDAAIEPLSTFSVDVDTASYSNIRRFINSGQQPPADAVRTEEMLNYFSYHYPQPTADQPISITTEMGDCPWQPGHKLVLIGLQGKKIAPESLPPSQLVFLIDVSGSMAAPNKLPLIKSSLKMLVSQLREQDKVAIVVYAGAAGIALEPTAGNEKTKIINAIDRLEAGGSTAGGEGIVTAYAVAKENFIKDGNNRIILATDGDFNVGVSSEGDLTRMIEQRRADGIYLSVFGFGMGNVKDNKMKAMADTGNGNYAYIDNLLEAKKVMIEQIAGTLYTIANDVKLQVEFNPGKVQSYRLIGYENRVLPNSDFVNDTRDAGDIGAGLSVTALYEIVPAEAAVVENPLTYQRTELILSDDWLQVKVRYKLPDQQQSLLLSVPVRSESQSENFYFAAAVAEYAMLLRNSEYKAQADYRQVIELANQGIGDDLEGYRREFIRMVKVSRLLAQ